MVSDAAHTKDKVMLREELDREMKEMMEHVNRTVGLGHGRLDLSGLSGKSDSTGIHDFGKIHKVT